MPGSPGTSSAIRLRGEANPNYPVPPTLRCWGTLLEVIGSLQSKGASRCPCPHPTPQARPRPRPAARLPAKAQRSPEKKAAAGEVRWCPDATAPGRDRAASRGPPRPCPAAAAARPRSPVRPPRPQRAAGQGGRPSTRGGCWGSGGGAVLWRRPRAGPGGGEGGSLGLTTGEPQATGRPRGGGMGEKIPHGARKRRVKKKGAPPPPRAPPRAPTSACVSKQCRELKAPP